MIRFTLGSLFLMSFMDFDRFHFLVHACGDLDI